MTIHQAYIIVYTHSFLYMGSTLIIHLVAVGSCYMVGINNMDDGTVRIVRTDDTRRYKPAIVVHYSSDNSHDHDRTKSRNNVHQTLHSNVLWNVIRINML